MSLAILAVLVIAYLCMHCQAGIQDIGTIQTKPARTCFDIHRKFPTLPSGVYWVRPNYNTTGIQVPAFQVYCDMEDKDADGNAGWTVIQRRENSTSSVSFYRGWAEYKNGFGSPETSYYMGNEMIYAMSSYDLTMRIDLFYKGDWYKADYSKFSLSSETDNYRLFASGFSSPSPVSPGDSFAGAHSGYPFSTMDKDNDLNSGNCAEIYKGAWWYAGCHSR
jgi:hypothetical protein